MLFFILSAQAMSLTVESCTVSVSALNLSTALILF